MDSALHELANWLPFTKKITGRFKIEAKLRPSWKLPSLAAPSPKKHTATFFLP